MAFYVTGGAEQDNADDARATEIAQVSFAQGWNAAMEEAAAVAASYPEGFGSEHAAAGLIRKGQDDAAKTIAEAILDLIQ